MVQKGYLNLTEAAEFLGIKKATLYKMTHEKRIPYYKPAGKNLYFSLDDLERFVERGKISATWEVEEAAVQSLNRRGG